jgi:hypothetical protein
MAPRKLYNFYIDPDLAAGLKVVKARRRAGRREHSPGGAGAWKKGAMKAGTSSSHPQAPYRQPSDHGWPGCSQTRRSRRQRASKATMRVR